MRLKTILLVLASTCILLSAAERKTLISISSCAYSRVLLSLSRIASNSMTA
jgi:hypothetical protein